MNHASLLDAFQAVSGFGQQALGIYSRIKKDESDAEIRNQNLLLAEASAAYLQNARYSNDFDNYMGGWKNERDRLLSQAMKQAQNPYTQKALEQLYAENDVRQNAALRGRWLEQMKEYKLSLDADSQERAGELLSGQDLIDFDMAIENENYEKGYSSPAQYHTNARAVYLRAGVKDAGRIVNKALFEDNLGLEGALGAVKTYLENELPARTLRITSPLNGGEGFREDALDKSSLDGRIAEEAERYAREQWNVRVKEEQTGNAKAASEKYGAMVGAYANGGLTEAVDLAKKGIGWLNTEMTGWRMTEADNTQYLDKFRSFYDMLLGKAEGGTGRGGTRQSGGGQNNINDLYSVKQLWIQGAINPDDAIVELNRIRYADGTAGAASVAQGIIDDMAAGNKPQFKGFTLPFQKMADALIEETDDPVRKFELMDMTNKYLGIVQQNIAKNMSRSDLEKSMQEMRAVLAGDVSKELNRVFTRGIYSRGGEGEGKNFFNNELDFAEYLNFAQAGGADDMIGRNLFTGETIYVLGEDRTLEIAKKGEGLLADMGYKAGFYDWAAQNNVYKDPSGIPVYSLEGGKKVVLRSDGKHLYPAEVTLSGDGVIEGEKPLSIIRKPDSTEAARAQAEAAYRQRRRENAGRVEAVKKLEGAARAREAQKLMDEGIILGDEYRKIVSVLDSLKALAEGFAPQSPIERNASGAIREQRKADIIKELKSLSGEEYRVKYDEYINSGKITEEDLYKARREGRF